MVNELLFILTILRSHEDEKKRQHNQRVMEVEQGTFTPFVLLTVKGVMAPEASIDMNSKRGLIVPTESYPQTD